MNSPQLNIFIGQIRSFPRNYWAVCMISFLAKFAYYSVFVVTHIYFISSGMSDQETVSILGIMALLVFVVPFFSSVVAEYIGYKKNLIYACAFGFTGYLLMGIVGSLSSYWLSLLAVSLAGIATGILRPIVRGAVARYTTETTATLGWGFFTLLVNIGAFLGTISMFYFNGYRYYSYIFYLSAALYLFVAMIVIYMFKEIGDKKEDQFPLLKYFITTLRTMLRDRRFLGFAILVGIFGGTTIKLWGLITLFLNEWINSPDFITRLDSLGDMFIDSYGRFSSSILKYINIALVILFIIPITYWIGKMQKVKALLLGMVIFLLGYLLLSMTHLIFICLIVLFVLALGEIIYVITIDAMVGLMGPRDKKAVYLVYFGGITGLIGAPIGWLIKDIYRVTCSKITLARRYMVEILDMEPDSVSDTTLLPDSDVMEKLANATQLSQWEATSELWNQYHPFIFWYFLTALGLLGFIGMIFFYFVTKDNLFHTCNDVSDEGIPQ